MSGLYNGEDMIGDSGFGTTDHALKSARKALHAIADMDPNKKGGLATCISIAQIELTRELAEGYNDGGQTSKIFKVHLYRDPRCIRGWLSYLRPSTNRPTVVVEVEAESGAKAKNKAITLANKDFVGLRVIRKNYADPLWGIHNFPDLVRIFGHK